MSFVPEAPRHRDRGEGLVDLEKIDVVDGHACFRERPFGGRDRSFQHDDRIAADHCEMVNACDGVDAQCLEARLAHDHDA